MVHRQIFQSDLLVEEDLQDVQMGEDLQDLPVAQLALFPKDQLGQGAQLAQEQLVQVQVKQGHCQLHIPGHKSHLHLQGKTIHIQITYAIFLHQMNNYFIYIV